MGGLWLLYPHILCSNMFLWYNDESPIFLGYTLLRQSARRGMRSETACWNASERDLWQIQNRFDECGCNNCHKLAMPGGWFIMVYISQLSMVIYDWGMVCDIVLPTLDWNRLDTVWLDLSEEFKKPYVSIEDIEVPLPAGKKLRNTLECLAASGCWRAKWGGCSVVYRGPSTYQQSCTPHCSGLMGRICCWLQAAFASEVLRVIWNELRLLSWLRFNSMQ